MAAGAAEAAGEAEVRCRPAPLSLSLSVTCHASAVLHSCVTSPASLRNVAKCRLTSWHVSSRVVQLPGDRFCWGRPVSAAALQVIQDLAAAQHYGACCAASVLSHEVSQRSCMQAQQQRRRPRQQQAVMAVCPCASCLLHPASATFKSWAMICNAQTLVMYLN